MNPGLIFGMLAALFIVGFILLALFGTTEVPEPGSSDSEIR
jgi:hypothetical protein